MSRDAWLSVLMPLHEGERDLPATLASLAREDLSGVEIFALDSSPTDRLRALLEQHSPPLPFVYLHVPELRSWTAKTNLAAMHASGKYLCMLHQDDLWLPGRIAALRRTIAEYPRAVLLLNPSTIVDRDGRDLGTWRCPLPAGREIEGSDMAGSLLIQNYVAIPAPVIRRDAWAAVRGLDEALWYTADWDLYLKLARFGSAVYQPTATTAFRIHGQSLTVTGSADLADFADQMSRVIERHIDLAPMGQRETIARSAFASSAINCALAQALIGNMRPLPSAIVSLVRLGPRQVVRYVHCSRIVERVIPRLRARLAGAL